MNLNAFAAIGLYAGLNALILLWISLATTKLRGKYKVSIGDGGNKHLQRIMRGHANAIENMAIVFILLIIMASLGTPPAILHGFGFVFTLSRLMHAWHFIQEDAPGWQRFYGTVLTLLVILITAIGVIGHSLLIMFT